jgi:hypothetical protein
LLEQSLLLSGKWSEKVPHGGERNGPWNTATERSGGGYAAKAVAPGGAGTHDRHPESSKNAFDQAERGTRFRCTLGPWG